MERSPSEVSAESSSASGPAPAHTPSTLFLWVLGLTAFCINLGYGIVIPISEELAKRCGGGAEMAHGSPEAFAALAVALMSFNLAKVLGEVPGGIFSDRVGDRVVVASSLLIYGLSVVILIWARNYYLFAAARFIEGLATGVSYPAMTSILLKHTPREKLGRNMSIALGAGVAGIVLGPPIAGPLTRLDALGWEKDIDRPLYVALFITVGVFALAVGWFWKAAARSAKAPDVDDVEVERKVVAAEGLVVAGPGPTSGEFHAREGFGQAVAREYRVLLRFGRSVPFLCLLAPLFFDKLIMCAWQVLLLAHAPRVGMVAVEDVGYLMGLLALSFAIVTPISGPLADRFSPRVLTHGSLIGIIVALVLMMLAPSKWTFIPAFFAYSVFSAALLTIHLKMVGDIYHEETQHGRIFGIVHALSDMGMILGPCFIWVYTSFGELGRIATFIAMAGLGAVTVPAFLFSRGREAQLPRP